MSTWTIPPRGRCTPASAIASSRRPAANTRDRDRARLLPGQAVTVDGQGGPITAVPILQEHGDIPSLGFRFGALAYSCDLSRLPDPSAAALAGVEVWIVDALRYRPHPSHFSVDDALAWIERIKPGRAILTNLHSDLDYEELRAKAAAPCRARLRWADDRASGRRVALTLALSLMPAWQGRRARPWHHRNFRFRAGPRRRSFGGGIRLPNPGYHGYRIIFHNISYANPASPWNCWTPTFRPLIRPHRSCRGRACPGHWHF